MDSLKRIVVNLLFAMSITTMVAQGASGTFWKRTEAAPFDTVIPSSCQDSVMLKIGLISDPQYCDCNSEGNRIYREVLKKLPVAIDSMNKFGVDFVMNLGDMIDRYYESYDSVNQFYQHLTMPYYNVLGNHDFEEIPDSLKPSIISRYGMPDFYYGFSFKNWRFLVLDGTELAAYSRSLHPDLAGEGDSLIQQVQDKYNNRPWNGGIGRTQRQWIKNQIQTAYDAEQNVILFCHFPVYPDSVYLNLWNSEDIIALIEEFPNVVAYINGHFHAGNDGIKKGIHYITQAAMLDTYDKNSFAMLEIYSRKLVFKGFGFNPDRILSYEDHFKVPFRFFLTDTVLNSTHHAGSYIGRFYSVSGSGIRYSFSSGSVEYKNEYFFISHDSLFLNTESDISVYEEIPIQVIGVDCSCDTVISVFKLQYDNTIQNATHAQARSLLKVYPNPVTGTLYVCLENPGTEKVYEMVIMDMQGNVIQKINPGTIDHQDGMIAVTLDRSIPTGSYLVRLSLPQQKALYSKFIIP